MLDTSVLNKISELIEKVTDKRRLDVDPTALQHLKLLCKASAESTSIAFELLLDRLKAQDAQACLQHPSTVTAAEGPCLQCPSV